MKQVMLALQQLLVNLGQNNSTSPLKDIKRVIFGDPNKIPETTLPVLTIAPINTPYIQRGNKYDQKVHNIEIRLVYNARTFYGKAENLDTDNKVYTVEDAITKMEDTKTNSVQETAKNTVAGIIESNPLLPYTPPGDTVRNTASHSRVVDIDYAGLKSERGFQTYEVVLTMEAQAVGDSGS